MIAEKSTNGAVAGDHTAETTPESTPTRIPAAKVPTTSPIPPRMTTAKTVPNHSYAVSGVSALDSAKTIPARAAVAPTTPPSSTLSRRWSTPNAPATARSWAMARSARPAKVRRSTTWAAITTSAASPKATSVVIGRTSRPSSIDRVAYGLVPADIRRKSALQMLLVTWMVMISSPKLTSSELNSVSRSRSNSHWMAAPATNSAGTVITSVRIGSRCQEVASWKVR